MLIQSRAKQMKCSKCNTIHTKLHINYILYMAHDYIYRNSILLHNVKLSTGAKQFNEWEIQFFPHEFFLTVFPQHHAQQKSFLKYLHSNRLIVNVCFNLNINLVKYCVEKPHTCWILNPKSMNYVALLAHCCCEILLWKCMKIMYAKTLNNKFGKTVAI